MKRFDLALFIGFLITLIFTTFGSFAMDCEEVREHTIRLHVVANSDSQEDQNLKLKVRDRIITSFDHIFSGNETIETAETELQSRLPEIEALAKDELLKNGVDCPVSVSITKMYFDTKTYENFTMPAGQYKALRVVIGEGKGRNWWCVMFPPMCVPAAMEDISGECEDTMTKIQELNQMVYVPKFKLIEWFEQIKLVFEKE